MRAVAAVGAERVLGRAAGRRPGGSGVGEGAGVAVEGRARVGGGETVRRGWRIIRPGQERRTTGERAGPPASQAGALALETARPATASLKIYHLPFLAPLNCERWGSTHQ